MYENHKEKKYYGDVNFIAQKIIYYYLCTNGVSTAFKNIQKLY